MNTLLSSCCGASVAYQLFEQDNPGGTYICDQCEKPCDVFSSDSDIIHNDKLMKPQRCACAHVTEDMIVLAKKIDDRLSEVFEEVPATTKFVAAIAVNLAELILETQKKGSQE